MTKTDRDIIRWVMVLTTATMALIALGIVFFGIELSWLLLPISWFVGAMMTWAFGKYKHNLYAPVAQR